MDRAMNVGPINRRRALTLFGVVGLGAVAAACNKKDSSSSSSGASASSGTSTSAVSTASCVLQPELTEGPYFLDGDQIRSDITEGKAGAPMALAITVVDADTCMPIEGASVDIWHADAAGTYSGFSSGGGGGGPGGGATTTDNETFLRGIQMTDANGVAAFATVFPGWYQGRTTHIHLKVRHDSQTHTGQLFFPEDSIDDVTTKEPYRQRGEPDTRNADDSIFGEDGGVSLVTITPAGDGYAASITVGVAPA